MTWMAWLGDQLDLLEEYWPEMVIRRTVLDGTDVTWFVASGISEHATLYDDAVRGATLLEAVNNALNNLGAFIPDQPQ